MASLSRCFRPFLTALALSTALFAAPQKPPANVILVTIDTLRPDHLGCYGYRNVETPNIDALAAGGVLFQHAFSAVPVTLPSHASILTGTYPMYSGMHDFSGNKLNPKQPTLASVLHDHGYATGAVIGAAVLDSRFGLDHGFDLYYDHFQVRPGFEEDLDHTERPGNEVMDLALDWLGKNRRHPFFIWIHLYDPHHPYRPPSPYAEKYKDHLYDGEIAFADAQLGRLLAFLKQNKLYSNSLVALMGDHGEGLGEHGEQTHGFFIYNSTMHVPLIFKLPAAPALPRREIATEVSLVDVMPTILESLQIPLPTEVQGHSLRALMRPKKSTEPGASDIYGESFLPRIHFNWSELRGIEIGGYHFIDAPQPELYDLRKDPGEVHNLYAEKKALASEYQGKLAKVVAQNTPDHALAEKTGLDPELAERLKSLGYAAVAGGGNTALSNRSLPDPKDRIQMYELVSAAIEEAQHGEYQPSIEKLRAALAVEKDSVPVRYLLGLNYYRVRNFADAARELERVLELSPTYAMAAYHLGLAYAFGGQYDRAINALNKALELDGTNFSAAFNLGAAYLKLEQVPQAMAAFRRAIEINPQYEQAYKAIAQLQLSRGEVDGAIQQLREAVRLAPNDPAAHKLLAQALRSKGMSDEADQEDTKAQQVRPD